MSAGPEHVSRLATGLPSRAGTAYPLVAFVFFQLVAVAQVIRSALAEDQSWLWLWVTLAIAWPCFWVGLAGSTNLGLARNASKALANRHGSTTLFRYAAVGTPRHPSVDASGWAMGPGWAFASAEGLELWTNAGPFKALSVAVSGVSSIERETVSRGLGFPRVRIHLTDGTAIDLNTAQTGLAGWWGPTNRSIDRAIDDISRALTQAHWSGQ